MRSLFAIGLCSCLAPVAYAQSEAVEPATIPVSSPESARPSLSESTPAAASRIGEIVVTARRTEESLQDVPMAIATLDFEQMAERQIDTVNDLAVSLPGLSGFQGWFPNSFSFGIRGQTTGYATSAPGVVAYVAEVADFSSFVYDLASIQVLKGPQGTLFGRNTTGGAVLLTPAKPRQTDRIDGFVQAEAGDYDRRNFEFGLDLPIPWIGEWFWMRLSGVSHKRDGYTIVHPSGEDLDDENGQSWRISLVVAPFEGFENYTVLQWDKRDTNGFGQVIDSYANAPTTPYQLNLGAYIREQEERGPRDKRSDLEDSQFYSKDRALANQTTWALAERWTVRNIFGYKQQPSSYFAEDIDGTEYRIEALISTPGKTQLIDRIMSEELQFQYRADAFDAIAGAYHQWTDISTADAKNRLSAPGSTAAAPIPLVIFATTGGTEMRSRAAFAQVTVRPFTESLSLTAGVRRTRDRTKTGDTVTSLGDPLELTDLRVPILTTPGGTLVQKATTWNVSADYAFTPDLMGYVTVREGYKQGGFNILNSDPDYHTYEPEHVRDHEIGVKSTLTIGDWQVRANVDVFYDKYRNIQRNLFLPGVTITQSVVNASSAEMVGAECDLLLAPVDWLEVQVQYTWFHGKYEKFVDETYGDLSVSEFPNTPDHQLSVVPSFRWDLPGEWGRLTATPKYYVQSKYYFDPINKKNGDPQNDVVVAGSDGEAFQKIDLRVGWDGILGSGLSVAAFATNLTDETYPIGAKNSNGINLIGVSSYTWAPPRMVGAELRYQFGGS